jgi:regulator of nucleoside diphosphate kinase
MCRQGGIHFGNPCHFSTSKRPFAVVLPARFRHPAAKGGIMRQTAQPIITQTDFQQLDRMLDSLEEFGPAAEALEEELERAKVVPPDQAEGVVTMHSQVHCREEGSGKEYHLRLVYPSEAKEEGTVSVLTPVGSALLGSVVGQQVECTAPGGKTLHLALLDLELAPKAVGY